MIFVGYSENSKGYKLFNPLTNKITISKDVIFDENKRWVINNESTETPYMIIEDNAGSTSQSINDQDSSDEHHESDPVQHENMTDNVEVNSGLTNSRQTQQHQDDSELNSASSQNQHDEETSSTDSENEMIRTRNINSIYRDTRALTNEEVLRKYNENQVINFVLYASADPTTYEEASKDVKWIDAMDKEMESIYKNQTWDLVDPPRNQKPIGVKWIYKTKYDEKGNVDKYKARLVVKGYNKNSGSIIKRYLHP
ncbi:putative RNA-directed DNA polymerase [Helianthus annuus]|nr:putative RNA-directed DNA polymerase [Helianthus annuus]